MRRQVCRYCFYYALISSRCFIYWDYIEPINLIYLETSCLSALIISTDLFILMEKYWLIHRQRRCYWFSISLTMLTDCFEEEKQLYQHSTARFFPGKLIVHQFWSLFRRSVCTINPKTPVSKDIWSHQIHTIMEEKGSSTAQSFDRRCGFFLLTRVSKVHWVKRGVGCAGQPPTIPQGEEVLPYSVRKVIRQIDTWRGGCNYWFLGHLYFYIYLKYFS